MGDMAQNTWHQVKGDTNMQTIMTKYLGPTDTKAPRVKAMTSSGHRGSTYTVEWDDSIDVEGNHAYVAQQLLDRLGWHGAWRMGSTDRGYVFVNVHDHNSPKLMAKTTGWEV